MRCLVGVFGLGLLLFFLGACTRPTTLKVTVVGVPAQSVSLAVSLGLQSEAGGAVQPLQGLDPYALPQPVSGQTSLVLRLPLAGDATLLLGVAAFSQAGGSGCLLGLGRLSHPYRTTILDDEVEVALAPYSEDARTGCPGSARIVATSPSTLTAAGGETLQVLGWGFVPAARIVLNGVPLATRYVSAGLLEATTPPSARLIPVPLSVELPGGTPLRYQGLRYVAKTLGFAPLTTFSLGDLYYDSEVADLDGDQRPDLIFYGDSYSGASQIVIAFQRAPLQFTVQQLSVGSDLAGLVVGDIDGDGDLDLVTASSGDQRLYVLKNDGQGNFTQNGYSTGMGATRLLSIHAMDINGDGALDVLLNNDATSLYTFPNDGQGRFSAATRQPTLLTEHYYSSDVTSLDYDLDGQRDLALIGYDVLTVFAKPGPVLPADDLKALVVDLPFDSGGPYQTVDMDGDAIADLVMVDSVGTPYILASMGAPPRDPIAIPASCPTFSFATGDLNGDGTVDILMGCEGGGNMLFALQSPTHTFSLSDQQLQLPPDTKYWSARLVDLDGDNKPDLIFSASPGLNTNELHYFVYRNVSQ